MARDYMSVMSKEQRTVRRCGDDFPHRRGIRIDDLRQQVTRSYSISRMMVTDQDAACFIVDVYNLFLLYQFRY